LASQLESSVDLDAMIKENYQLLRQGARVDSKLNRRDDEEDSDVNGPADGRPVTSYVDSSFGARPTTSQ